VALVSGTGWNDALCAGHTASKEQWDFFVTPKRSVSRSVSILGYASNMRGA